MLGFQLHSSITSAFNQIRGEDATGIVTLDRHVYELSEDCVDGSKSRTKQRICPVNKNTVTIATVSERVVKRDGGFYYLPHSRIAEKSPSRPGYRLLKQKNAKCSFNDTKRGPDDEDCEHHAMLPPGGNASKGRLNNEKNSAGRMSGSKVYLSISRSFSG
ncbi:unnamed protein product [Aspergillus oryzae]|uniref:Unnamed protein product n=1 Tax=Aspergillus oryzae var. brunneus TaxID=332754 RepID=A0ABQ6LAK3_ASPOZ|nr:unnamed protein product [Aspergillus oryzae]GMG55124.1 unnamed protein product [Aspergillus oryzae var. brunneus]